MQIVSSNIKEIPKGILSVEDDHILLCKPGIFGTKKKKYAFNEIVDLSIEKSGPGFGAGSGSFEKYAPDGFDNYFKIFFRDGSQIITRYFSSKMTGWTANEMMTQMEALLDAADMSIYKKFIYSA